MIKGPYGLARRGSRCPHLALSREPGQLVQEALILDVLQERHCLWIGRITSATSRSASPISEVTLSGTDCAPTRAVPCLSGSGDRPLV